MFVGCLRSQSLVSVSRNAMSMSEILCWVWRDMLYIDRNDCGQLSHSPKARIWCGCNGHNKPIGRTHRTSCVEAFGNQIKSQELSSRSENRQPYPTGVRDCLVKESRVRLLYSGLNKRFECA